MDKNSTKSLSRLGTLATSLLITTIIALPFTFAQPDPSENTLVVAVSSLPTELDPDYGESSEKGNVLRQIFDLPTWYDSQGVLHPWVFESWEVINEGLTYRVKIREGLTFASGTPVNAETVKFTFDRMVDPEMLAAGANNQFPLRANLVGTVVVDEYTLDINTEEPNVLVPARLYVVYLVDPSFYDGATPEQAATEAHGGGPYRLVEFVSDDYAVMERVEGYWAGTPDIERLVFRAVPETSSRIAMLETGEVDIALGLAPDDISIVERIPGVHIAAIEGARRIGLVFNQRLEKFQDKRVRQAFNLAIDWEEIDQALLHGLSSRAVTYRGSDYCANPELSPYPYDPERALALLQEANFPMDETITIDISSSYGYRVPVVQAMASQLERLGLDVEVNVIEFSVYMQMITNREFNDLIEIGLGGRGVPVQDAEVLMDGALWHPGGWDDEQAREFNSLLAEMKTEFNEDVTCQMTKELEAITYDAAPWLFSHHSLVIAGVNDRVNWKPRIDDQLFFREATWAE
jgi:peptide/nickel transport system substrate-binding protein